MEKLTEVDLVFVRAGSVLSNSLKAEINDLVRTVLGLVSKETVEGYNRHGIILNYVSNGLLWGVRQEKKKLYVWVTMPGHSGVWYDSRHDVEMSFSRLTATRCTLLGFVNEFVRVFPEVSCKLEELRKAGGYRNE